VIRDKEGKPLSVRYEDVNVMLLNEFLKEHKNVEEQQSKIDSQQARSKDRLSDSNRERRDGRHVKKLALD
jgi:hypothetical protein